MNRFLVGTAIALLWVAPALARHASVVQVTTRTTLCTSYASAMIAKQIRKGTVHAPIPNFLNIALPGTDGTNTNYWVDDNEVTDIAYQD